MPSKTYNKCVINGTTYLDISSDTVTSDKLLYGYTAHDKNGVAVTGNMGVQTYYTGSSAPSSSTGNNGDLYLQT